MLLNIFFFGDLFTECIKIIINTDHGWHELNGLCYKFVRQCIQEGRITPTGLPFLPVYLDAITNLAQH